MRCLCSLWLSLRLTHRIQEQCSARHDAIAASQTVPNYEEAIRLAIYMYLAPAKLARLLLKKYNRPVALGNYRRRGHYGDSFFRC
jgi:hypothetical protein